MIWKDAFKEGNEIVLTTASKTGVPRAIVVSSLGFSKDKLLIGICQMKKSFENLKETQQNELVQWVKNCQEHQVTPILSKRDRNMIGFVKRIGSNLRLFIYFVM